MSSHQIVDVRCVHLRDIIMFLQGVGRTSLLRYLVSILQSQNGLVVLVLLNTHSKMYQASPLPLGGWGDQLFQERQSEGAKYPMPPGMAFGNSFGCKWCFMYAISCQDYDHSNHTVTMKPTKIIMEKVLQKFMHITKHLQCSVVCVQPV